MTFQSDLDTDRDNVILDAAGSGFGEAATYTAIATDTDTAITVVPEEQIFNPRDPENQTRFHISAAAIALPVPGDLVVHGGFTWGVVNIRTLDNMHAVDCVRLDTRM